WGFHAHRAQATTHTHSHREWVDARTQQIFRNRLATSRALLSRAHALAHLQVEAAAVADAAAEEAAQALVQVAADVQDSAHHVQAVSAVADVQVVELVLPAHSVVAVLAAKHESRSARSGKNLRCNQHRHLAV